METIANMQIVNRHAIVIKVKQPFVDWVNSTKEIPDEEDYTVGHINDEPTVFLMPSFEDTRIAEEFIADAKPELFEHLLNGWYTDETAWPKNRNAELFDKWFDIEYASMVQDIDESEHLGHEEWDE